jgi:threonine dehydratase
MPNKFDYVVFPIGGGGLGSGTLLSTKYFGNGCKAIGVEPELAGDAYLSIRDKKIHPQFPPVTIADGLRVNLGEIPFSILSK